MGPGHSGRRRDPADARRCVSLPELNPEKWQKSEMNSPYSIRFTSILYQFRVKWWSWMEMWLNVQVERGRWGCRRSWPTAREEPGAEAGSPPPASSRPTPLSSSTSSTSAEQSDDLSLQIWFLVLIDVCRMFRVYIDTELRVSDWEHLQRDLSSTIVVYGFEIGYRLWKFQKLWWVWAWSCTSCPKLQFQTTTLSFFH